MISLYQVVNRSQIFRVQDPKSSTHGIGISIFDVPIVTNFTILSSTNESMGNSSKISSLPETVILSVLLNFIGNGLIVMLSTLNFEPPAKNYFKSNFFKLIDFNNYI